jgi:hypothetical protein
MTRQYVPTSSTTVSTMYSTCTSTKSPHQFHHPNLICTSVIYQGFGPSSLFFRLEIWQRDGEIFVSQGKYAREILGKFHMEGYKPMDTPLPRNWRKEDATSGEVVDDIVYR